MVDTAVVAAPMPVGEWVVQLHDQGRHWGTVQLAQWFAWDHLRDPRAKQVSASCAALAQAAVHDLADGPELTAGLRKLLEAKDCFVRQAITSVGT